MHGQWQYYPKDALLIIIYFVVWNISQTNVYINNSYTSSPGIYGIYKPEGPEL